MSEAVNTGCAILTSSQGSAGDAMTFRKTCESDDFENHLNVHPTSRAGAELLHYDYILLQSLFAVTGYLSINPIASLTPSQAKSKVNKPLRLLHKKLAKA